MVWEKYGLQVWIQGVDLYRNPRRYLQHLSFAILFSMLFFCMPAFCDTTEVCPWLNAATAGGFLGGRVTSNVTHPGPNKYDATCEFVRHEGPLIASLRIEVETMKDPPHDFVSYNSRCGTDATPLRAIGNEALVCSLQGKKKQISEQVVSRVRERAFVVRVSSNANPPVPSTLREQARRAAEQVAGMLF
jgi:hypothetical protein